MKDFQQPVVSDKKIPLMSLACWVFAISIFLEILSSRALYADGAFNFITNLQSEKFPGFGGVRAIADDFFYFPLIAAAKLGVTNLFWLRMLFGFGCFLPWPLTLALCHRLAPKHFWLAAIACAAGYLNTALMAVGEHIVAHAFFWPAVFTLVFGRPLTRFASAALLISATILLESYESLLFLGPLLVGLTLWRGFSRDEKLWQRIIFFVAAFLFGAATIIALATVLEPSNTRELGGFKTGTFVTLLNPGWTIKWSALWIFVMLGVCFSQKFRRLVATRAGIFIFILAIFIWGIWPLLKPGDFYPSQQFAARFLDLLVPLLLLPVALALKFFPKWFEFRRQQLIAFTACFLLAQSLWQISATWQWHDYVKMLRGVLTLRAGYISVSETPLARSPLNHFTWYWDNPCLCIALSPDGNVRTMLQSAPDGYAARWQPFDPLDPKNFPDLRRYGVNYSNYIAAISAPSQK
jgi:hypothetical protein